MNRLQCSLEATILVVLVFGLADASGRASLVSGDAVPMGRENPFAELMTTPSTPVAPPTELMKERPALVLETVVLKFLDATSLKTVLDKMVTPFGMVAVNQKNNSVVVCDTAENMARILAEIRKADRIPQQVMVEVVILDVQLKNDTEIGINWDLLSDERYDIGCRPNFGGSPPCSAEKDAGPVGNATAFNAIAMGGDVSVVNGTVRHVLRELQQTRDVDILASPSTLVVSGQSATIQAVEEIPYKELIDSATGGQEALSATQFKEVGVTLQVTATVTDGNNIFVTVRVEQNVQTGVSEQGAPVVDTRRANTSLLLEDGQIVVMGGLRRKEEIRQVRRGLPLVGRFFKSPRAVRTVTNQSELVVLLSPHIDRGEPVPDTVAARYEAIRGASLLSRGQEPVDASTPSQDPERQHP